MPLALVIGWQLQAKMGCAANVSDLDAGMSVNLMPVGLDFDIAGVALAKMAAWPEGFNAVLVEHRIKDVRDGLAAMIEIGMAAKNLS